MLSKTFWSIAFRPFFLFSIAWSFLVLLIWTSTNQGYAFVNLSTPASYWHGHEMIFGVMGAILAGFLFTASSNWTGTPPLSDGKLQSLFSAWALARILSLTPFQYAYLFFDLIFFSLFLYYLSKILFIKSQKRNHLFLIVTLLFLLTNVSSHLGFIFDKTFLIMMGLHVGLNLILIYISIITGRVLPFFTKNVIHNSTLVKIPKLDAACTASLFLILIVSAKGPASNYFVGVTLLSAALHFTRWLLWKPHETIKKPILLTLYISYLWLILGLVFMALRTWLELPVGVALHAQTVGALGGFIFSMVTRVSLGHTGRVIHASPMIIMIILFINLGAITRVFAPIISVDFYNSSILISGGLWMAAALLFVIKFYKILTQPRINQLA